MSRGNMGVALFFTAALSAMVAMFVAGRPRHPVAPKADPAPITIQTTINNAPAGERPRALRGAPDPAFDPSSRIVLPPGYRETNATNFMRMRLRELGLAEEQYYNEAQAYTTDLSKLMLARRTGDVVVLRVTYAGPAGWSGEATHPAAPGKSCVTYTGPTSVLPRIPATIADHATPLGERDLVCDKL